MRFVSWNIDLKAMSRKRMARIVERVAMLNVDVGCFQEVPVGWDEDLEAGLQAHGLRHWSYARHRGDRCKYGVMTGSRRPHAASDRLTEFPFPEFALDVAYDGINIVNVHIPNGSGFKFKKIEAIRALRTMVLNRKVSRQVVAGDFNAPALELANETLCFGQQLAHGKRWKRPSTVADSIDRDAAGNCKRRYRPADSDHPGGGVIWEEAEGWIFNRAHEARLRDAFRALHPVGSTDADYSHVSKGGGGGKNRTRRFDHIFATEDLQPVSADYCIESLDNNESDHAPLIVEFRL